jgi:hypothetical protein
LAEARATAAARKAQGEKMAAEIMLGRTAATRPLAPALPLLGNHSSPPPAPTWQRPGDCEEATAPVAGGRLNGDEQARRQSEMASFLEDDDDEAGGPDRGSVHGTFKAPAPTGGGSGNRSGGSAPSVAALPPKALPPKALPLGERAARRASGAHAFAPKPNYLPANDLGKHDARAFLDSDDEADRPSIGGFA